jgi:hypothetical protein
MQWQPSGRPFVRLRASRQANFDPCRQLTGTRSVAKPQAWSDMGSTEPIKLLYHFETDQVHDLWLFQPKIIVN